jgi:hypothetical protein
MKLRILLFVVASAVLTLPGARAAAPVVVTHVADAKKTSSTVRTTEQIKIVLPVPTDAPPDYEWQNMSNDSRVLRLTSSPRLVTATEKTAAATWSTTYVALRPGRSILRFVYVPKAENTVETSFDNREIIVNVR